MIPPHVLVAAESLAPGNGGICRVARLMALVLGDMAGRGRGDIHVLGVCLSDRAMKPSFPFPVAYCEKSRLRFVLEVMKAAGKSSHAIYDSLSMSRAHPRLPFLNRPFLCYVHGIEVWENTRPDRLAWARRATMLVCNTHFTKTKAERLHGICGQARVCWLATEEDALPDIQPAAVCPPRVLIVARMSREEGYKGHQELIAAWPRVVAAVPDARLTIVGRGDAAELYQRLAAQLPCRDNIEFLGFVPEDHMPALWSNTTVFAMPSRGEGFGLVYIEAMRYGIPVIASIHDAGQEVNVDGQTSYNVNLDKPDELPERLIHLLKNPDLSLSMGQRSQARWKEHFRFSAFRARFRPILEEFLAMYPTHNYS